MPVRAVGRFVTRLRLALWDAAYLVIVVVAIGLILLAALESRLRADVDEGLLLRAQHVEHGIAIPPGARIAQAGPLAEFTEPGIYLQVLDSAGARLGTSAGGPVDLLPKPPEVVAQALAGRQIYATVLVDGERVRLLAMPIFSTDRVIGAILIGESLHELETSIHRERVLLGASAIGAALFLLLGSWLTRKRAMQPVAAVTRVAHRIAATGRFEQRIEVSSVDDELRDLVSTFNEMLARLEHTFNMQRDFLADASHELRHPLTVIGGNLDLLQMPLSDEERFDSVREARGEVRRMNRLVSELLFLAAEDAQARSERQPVALDDLLLTTFERARAADAGRHTVRVTCNDRTLLQGNRDRLDQMIWNLVENAMRYTNPGGSVGLSLRNLGQVAELEVTDTGIGISGDQIPLVFERFYRVDRAHARRIDSTGLGLAIVKQVVEAHGGRIRVRSTPQVGSTFTITLPITPA